MLPVQRGTFLVLNSKQCKLKRKSTRVTSCHLAYDHNAPTCLPTKFAQVKASTVHSIRCTMHMARQVTVVTVVARLFNATGLLPLPTFSLSLTRARSLCTTMTMSRYVGKDGDITSACGADGNFAVIDAHKKREPACVDVDECEDDVSKDSPSTSVDGLEWTRTVRTCMLCDATWHFCVCVSYCSYTTESHC